MRKYNHTPPASPAKDCRTCRHEPEWAKCISADTWLHGLCSKTKRVLNRRRKYSYSWDVRIENCEAWEGKDVENGD